MKKLFKPHASVKVTFILLTLKYVSVIVNLVDDLLCIHWTMLSGSGRKEFKFTEYYRSVKAKTVYNAGLLNCARLYSSFGDHRFYFIYYWRLHQLLILGIPSLMNPLVIKNDVGEMVRIYWRFMKQMQWSW